MTRRTTLAPIAVVAEDQVRSQLTTPTMSAPSTAARKSVTWNGWCSLS